MKQAFYPNKLWSLLFILLLSSCVASTGIVGSSAISAPGVNVRNFQTFGWYQEKAQAPEAFDKGFTATADKHIRQAIEEELTRKGLRKVSDNPDVLVAYDISISVPAEHDRAELYAEGFGYSYAYMAGYRYRYGNGGLPAYRPVDLFKQGTLIIDVVNPKTDELIWRGWTEGVVTNFNANAKKFTAYVEEILAKYPGQGALTR